MDYYDTDELYKKAKEVIENNNLIFMQDVYDFLGISSSTFYKHFPVGEKRSNSLKEILQENKVGMRVGVRKSLMDSTSASALIAMMKIVGTDEEKKAVSKKYIEHSTDKESEVAKVLRESIAKHES